MYLIKPRLFYCEHKKGVWSFKIKPHTNKVFLMHHSLYYSM